MLVCLSHCRYASAILTVIQKRFSQRQREEQPGHGARSLPGLQLALPFAKLVKILKDMRNTYMHAYADYIITCNCATQQMCINFCNAKSCCLPPQVFNLTPCEGKANIVIYLPCLSHKNHSSTSAHNWLQKTYTCGLVICIGNM